MKSYMDLYKLHTPKSALCGQYYVFWKSLDGLTIEDMTYLITVRLRDMRHDCDIKRLRTELSILRDAIKITRAQNEMNV